jgi:ABC-type glutathione transport system ATPase component
MLGKRGLEVTVKKELLPQHPSIGAGSMTEQTIAEASFFSRIADRRHCRNDKNKENIMSIQRQSVTKEYQLGKTTVNALRGVPLGIKQGEFVELVGPSGSGKSTTLHILGALDRPTSGEVRIQDTPVTNMNDKQLARLWRERIDFIFQSFHLIPVLNVYSNVEFPRLLMKMPKQKRRNRVMAMLERVGLQDRAKHKTEELSGGQRQRGRDCTGPGDQPKHHSGKLSELFSRALCSALEWIGRSRWIAVFTSGTEVHPFRRLPAFRQIHPEFRCT